MKQFVFIALLLIAAIKPVRAGEIRGGQQVTSPDGRFTARVSLTDEDGVFFRIKDNHTGKMSEPYYGYFYALNWTGDSRSLVFIRHSAGGMDAGVMHFEKNTWKDCYATEQRIGERYKVLQEVVGFHTVGFTYRVYDQKKEMMCAYSFVLHPEKDVKTDEKIREMRDEDWNKMLEVRVEGKNGK